MSVFCHVVNKVRHIKCSTKIAFVNLVKLLTIGGAAILLPHVRAKHSRPSGPVWRLVEARMLRPNRIELTHAHSDHNPRAEKGRRTRPDPPPRARLRGSAHARPARLRPGRRRRRARADGPPDQARQGLWRD